nr:S8 family peptidase [uncultured Anaerosporobacter sp.]
MANRIREDILMNERERYKITSNDYADIIIEFSRYTGEYDLNNMTILSDRYAIIHIPVDALSKDSINQYGYEGFPSCLDLTSTIDLEASGVLRVQQVPNLNLRGNNVLVGIIDTGINYTHPAFLHTDGTTRIQTIWDQTIESEDSYPPKYFYGTEFSSEQINLALQSDNPLDIVPSTDTNGHGTMLAGVAAGTESTKDGFSGVVPESELVIVKLKEAKTFTKEFFLIPEDVLCYQETDIILATKYLVDYAMKVNRPIAICIGLGTNQGGHDYKGVMSSILARYSVYAGVGISTSAGNELNLAHHYYGVVERNSTGVVAEVNIGISRPSFSMELWSSVPSSLTAEIISPTGESFISPPTRLIETRRKDFIFENTTIWVNNISLESQTGDQLILFRLQNPSSGVWRFRITSRNPVESTFHMWLPSKGFIPADTLFLKPNPDTIILSPGNAEDLIAVGAYNTENDSIYVNSSRGPTRLKTLRPDFCAPGVNILGPNLAKSYTTGTGTGLAAAHVTGLAAMLLEWGIVRGNLAGMGTPEIKTLLIRGAVQKTSNTYPNNSWGYGAVNIYNSFQSL